MANAYKSFYLHDILETINEIAMDCLMSPVFDGKRPDGVMMTLAEISNHNSLVSMNNAGVLDFAQRLKAELMKEDEDKDD